MQKKKRMRNTLNKYSYWEQLSLLFPLFLSPCFLSLFLEFSGIFSISKMFGRKCLLDRILFFGCCKKNCIFVGTILITCSINKANSTINVWLELNIRIYKRILCDDSYDHTIFKILRVWCENEDKQIKNFWNLLFLTAKPLFYLSFMNEYCIHYSVFITQSEFKILESA